MHNARIISSICDLLSSGDTEAAAHALVERYPLAGPQVRRGAWSKTRLIKVFIRDGFTDRYSGEPLVFPGTLRAITLFLPEQFPYHPNWKQSETHPAYWDLSPTVDHVVPVARGGADEELNVVTTSMLRNAAKANWLIEEMQWSDVRAPLAEGWDGLLSWFFSTYEKHDVLQGDVAARSWYRAAKSVL
jgi:hypothetical protein